MTFSLATQQAGATPELMGGDAVAIPNPNDATELLIHSLREQRGIGTR